MKLSVNSGVLIAFWNDIIKIGLAYKPKIYHVCKSSCPIGDILYKYLLLDV